MAEYRTTRRRFLAILGSATIAPVHSIAAAGATEWRGTALGADACIMLEGEGRVEAKTVIAECIAEIERLDRVFSLYRLDSELSRLNATGRSDEISLDLRHVLEVSRDLNRATFGLFDPTIQPLWRLYADWYAGDSNRAPLPRGAIEDRLAIVGLDRILLEEGQVRMPPGAALTLNGIAQGYIADRVADLLRDRGWRHVLADIGEVRAVGGRADEQPFSVGVRDSGLEFAVKDAALATSSAAGLMFSPADGLAHIIHPRTGVTSSPWHCVTVRHASAMIADGLSTALVLAKTDMIAPIVRSVGGTAWLTSHDGSTTIFEG